MKALFPLLLLGLVGVASAASVGTETREGTDTKQGATSEQSKNIQIRKGQSKRDVSGSDRRSADERARERRQTDDITAELQGSTLFLPMLQQIELGEVDTGENPVAALFRSCKFFTQGPAIPVALGARPDPEELAFLEGRPVTISYQPGADMPRIRVSGDIISERYDWYDTSLAYRLDAARTLVRCNFAYGMTIAAAMRILAKGATVRETPLKEKVVLVHGDLQERGAAALVAAMREPALLREIERNVQRVTGGECSLPTVAGLNHGNTDWQCGSLQVTPGQLRATLGGMTVLGENQYMGQRLSFAQVSGQSTTARSSESRSTYTSRDATRETGRELSMGKRQTDTRDVSTATGASGNAAANATPR